jgi:transposase
MNVGKTLFAQVMEFIPWTSFGRIVDRYAGNAGVRRMNCAEHFRVMAFAQLTWRESLRDIEATLGANANKLYAMGLRHAVHRSTLADANDARDWRIWAELAALLMRRARKMYRDDGLGAGLGLTNTVYALDATTIDLCLSLFDWAPFRATKAAIKLHTLLDLRGAIPAFIHISDGKLHEVKVLDFLPIEAGAFYVMDRGYLDFARLYTLHQAGAFFVTRAKRGMNARRVYSTPTERATGVICDQTIALNGFYVSTDYPEHLRRIRFKDPASGKTLVFLTNNTTLPPLTIAALYQQRWQVELFFKWIKQHLRIKKFLGTSENAVKTQIWCAVSTYVLIAIVKKELHLNASLYTLLQILSVSVFEKSPLVDALQPNLVAPESSADPNQLNLFDI